MDGPGKVPVLKDSFTILFYEQVSVTPAYSITENCNVYLSSKVIFIHAM